MGDLFDNFWMLFGRLLDNFFNLASFTIEVALILFFSAPEESKIVCSCIVEQTRFFKFRNGFSIPHTSQEEVP